MSENSHYLPNPNSQQSDAILAQRDGAKVTIRLNNPAVRNRLLANDISYLRALIKTINNDTAIRVVVLTGSGKSFCAGFDLNELSGLAEQGKLPAFDHLANELEQLRCPVICALNGGVYGGAIELALACDFRIAVTTAELIMPVANIGLHYYPSGIRRYVSHLGMAVSKRLLLCAEPIKGEALVEIGFADELVSPEQFEARTSEMASLLENKAPIAVEGMKQAINLYANAQIDDRIVHQSFALALSSSDFKAGIASAREKTPPVFQRE